MKKMFIITCLLALSHVYSHTIQPKAIQDSLIYVSPGRGGTHLLRLILQHYTKRPFYRILPQSTSAFHLRRVSILDIVSNHLKKPFYHTHDPKKCRLIDTSTNQLILITRNPKELMTSRAKRAITKNQLSLTPPEVEKYITQFLLNSENYQRPMNQLRAFDEWPEDKRFFITYEDLLNQSQESIEKLMTFLGEDPAIVAPGLEQLQTLQKQSIELYNQTCKRSGGSLSNGASIDFHTHNLASETLKAVDSMLESQYPDLWKKYLFRYQESSTTEVQKTAELKDSAVLLT